MQIVYRVISGKSKKIILTFVGYRVIVSKVAEQANNKYLKMIGFEAFFERAEEINRKKLKKLLTNKTAHDNINELLRQAIDKQH